VITASLNAAIPHIYENCCNANDCIDFTKMKRIKSTKNKINLQTQRKILAIADGHPKMTMQTLIDQQTNQICYEQVIFLSPQHGQRPPVMQQTTPTTNKLTSI
jgi:hypothetical protein